MQPGVLVVDHDLRMVGDAEPAERRRQRVHRWQRMTAVQSSARACEVGVQARIHRTGDVSLLVLLTSPLFIGEIEAAIDDRPLAEMIAERIG